MRLLLPKYWIAAVPDLLAGGDFLCTIGGDEGNPWLLGSGGALVTSKSLSWVVVLFELEAFFGNARHGIVASSGGQV